MPSVIKAYVRYVDAMNRLIGRATMYLIFVMMGLLLFSSFSKIMENQPLWIIEMAQFMMASYYLLGGAYSMQLGSHVRMDLLYSHWSAKTKARSDAITVLMLIFYLSLLLYGGFSSTGYALQYGETSYSSWGPYMAPIKIIMTVGIGLMLLQSIAAFFRNFAEARGEPLPPPTDTLRAEAGA